MSVTVCFYSYFKDLAGCARTTATLPEGSTVGELLETLAERFPRLGALEKSTLAAVGLDYQHRSCRLKEGDEVSLFPPVQGG
jgi:molybdopterin converting factor small subunit